MRFGVGDNRSHPEFSAQAAITQPPSPPVPKSGGSLGSPSSYSFWQSNLVSPKSLFRPDRADAQSAARATYFSTRAQRRRPANRHASNHTAVICAERRSGGAHSAISFPTNPAMPPSGEAMFGKRAHRPLRVKKNGAHGHRSRGGDHRLANKPKPTPSTAQQIRHGSKAYRKIRKPIAAAARQTNHQTQTQPRQSTPTKAEAAPSAEFQSPVPSPLHLLPFTKNNKWTNRVMIGCLSSRKQQRAVHETIAMTTRRPLSDTICQTQMRQKVLTRFNKSRYGCCDWRVLVVR